MVAIATLCEGQALHVRTANGVRTLKTQAQDKFYYEERGRRGARLGRDYRKVEGLFVTDD